MPDFTTITDSELMTEVRKRNLLPGSGSGDFENSALMSIDQIMAELQKRYTAYSFAGLVFLDKNELKGRYKTHFENHGCAFRAAGLAYMVAAKADRHIQNHILPGPTGREQGKVGGHNWS